MAFSMKYLHRNNLAGPSRMWSYWTLEDTIMTVKTRNYFEDAKELLAVGDWIFVTASNGGTILHVNEIDPLELDSPR